MRQPSTLVGLGGLDGSGSCSRLEPLLTDVKSAMQPYPCISHQLLLPVPKFKISLF